MRMTHDIEGRPLFGCTNASPMDLGCHSWEKGEIDVWEWPAGVQPGEIIGDRMDVCRRCNLKVPVFVKRIKQ